MKRKLLISIGTLTFFRKTILSVACLFIISAITTSCNQNYVTDNGFNIVAKGDSLYYPNFKKGTKLYKMNYDGSNITKVSNSVGVSLNADDEFIYYKNLMNQTLYKMNDSGTIKITDIKIQSFSVLNGSIYFTSDKGVYSISTSGQNLKRLSDKSSSFIYIYNKLIYFISVDNLFSMDLDGSNIKEVIDYIVGSFIILENIIYFLKYDDDNNIYLYRADLEGHNLTKTISARLETGAFDVTEDGIFFNSTDSDSYPSLFRANLDGSNPTKIAHLSGTYIKVFGTYLYSYHPASGGHLDMIDLKTNEVTPIL